MTIIDRAVRLIELYGTRTGSPRDVALELAIAGLLAPELPEPITPENDPEWAQEYMAEWEWVPDAEWHPTNDFFINAKDGNINAGFGMPQEEWDGTSPDELRSIALALLAAAQHAKEKQ